MDVIIFAPHPDDESFSAAGTLAKHVKESGDSVTIVFMTDGRFGNNPFTEGKYTPDQLASTRMQEALDAANAMGVGPSMVHFLGYYDQDLGNANHHDEAIKKVLEFLPKKPDIVYVAMTNYGHTDHLAMYFIVFETLEKAEFQGEIRVSKPQGWGGLANPRIKDPTMKARIEHINKVFPIISEIRVDISNTILEKLNAIKAHKTQMGMFANLVSPKDDFDTVLLEIFDDYYHDKVEPFEVRKRETDYI